MSGIFTEGCERFDKALARHSPDRRDEMIEEMLFIIRDTYELDFDIGKSVSMGQILDMIAKAKREGYGQAGGEK